MPLRRIRTERTEHGVRLEIMESGGKARPTLTYQVTSLRRTPDRLFRTRAEADAAFEAEVVASRDDPWLRSKIG